MKKINSILLAISFILIASIMLISRELAMTNSPKLWQVESIDTMKYSRDASRDPNIYKLIPKKVAEVANLHANYIAIDTPYDEEFYPVLKAWVTEARKNHLRVWFRGNFSSWEGWFGYDKFKDINEHHKLTHNFILKHPDLFEDGDIFTPVPEAENGGLGDPRGSDLLASQFNDFLVASYNNCVSSFNEIHIQISCGYFSVNGDVAKQVLTRQTVAETGNVIVIDHYVSSPDDMSTDITYLHNKLGGKIVLGEFGAPILDINGNMTDQEQANFLESILNVFYKNKDIIQGVNYWTASGSSTSLYHEDGTKKQAADIVSKYYSPNTITGKITNTIGTALNNITITTDNEETQTETDSNGYYHIVIPANNITISINDPKYYPLKQAIKTNSNDYTQNIILDPYQKSLFYSIILEVKKIFRK